MAVDVSEQEQDWAKSAKDAFDSHRFENCLSTLNKLLESRRRDARVAHNRAVAQYMLSNLTHTDDFRKTLQSVSSQFSEEEDETGEEGVVSDTGVLLYNQALIHLKLHQNTQASLILGRLFKARDSLSNHLAIDVCILLIEVCIATYQLTVASSHIDFVEAKLFADSSRENGDFTHEVAERYRTKLYSFRARLSLLHGSIKSSKKEVKSYINMAGNTACGVLLKANVEYLKQNYQKAMKMLSSPPKSPIVTDSGECLSAFFFNNIACLHFHMKRYHLGAYFLCKAIEENDSALNGFPPLDRATPLSGRPLSVLGVNCRHILLYNMGLQQLFAGQPLAAFDSLLEVVQVYHANPRLWLRLAEACIATHVKSIRQDPSGKGKLIHTIIGKGHCRKVVVETCRSSAGPASVELHSQSAAMPAPTLEFSAVCLKNALFLLTSYTGGVASSSSVCPFLPGPPMQGDAITSLRCSILSCLSYVALGLGDPVSALAYSRDLRTMPGVPAGLLYLARLYSAEALVLLERVPEALQLLSPDSIQDISFTVAGKMEEDNGSGDSQPSPPPVTTKVEGCLSDLQQSRAVMSYNRGVVFCVLKEHDKAKQCMIKAAGMFGAALPRELVQLAAYIELTQGNTVQAVQILRRTQSVLT